MLSAAWEYGDRKPCKSSSGDCYICRCWWSFLFYRFPRFFWTISTADVAISEMGLRWCILVCWDFIQKVARILFSFLFFPFFNFLSFLVCFVVPRFPSLWMPSIHWNLNKLVQSSAVSWLVSFFDRLATNGTLSLKNDWSIYLSILPFESLGCDSYSFRLAIVELLSVSEHWISSSCSINSPRVTHSEQTVPPSGIIIAVLCRVVNSSWLLVDGWCVACKHLLKARTLVRWPRSPFVLFFSGQSSVCSGGSDALPGDRHTSWRG